MLVFFGAILAVLGPDIMSDVDLIGPGAFNPAKQAFFMYILQTSLTFSSLSLYLDAGCSYVCF